MSNVKTSLDDIFQTHRIVFWYDAVAEMGEEFSAYEADGVVKIHIENNEFGVKHRVMREEPQKKFLLYLPYSRQDHRHNWLLDLELANRVFYADGVSLILQRLGWQEEHRDFVVRYKDFFNSKDRLERLADKLHPDDFEREWQIKMLSVLCRESPTLEDCLLGLVAELACHNDEKWQLVEKYGLSPFFWKEVDRVYDYKSETPSILDLIIEVFSNAAPIGAPGKLGKEARLFLGRWKDSQRFGGVFEGFSQRIESDLHISGKLNDVDGYHLLLGYDAFEAIERKIVVEIRDDVLKGAINASALKSIIERRETSYWFGRYRDVYASLQSAVELTETLRTLNLEFQTAAEGVGRYSKSYWKVDQFYRHFHYHLKKSQQVTLLDAVREDVERRYVNEFLLRLGDRFQSTLDEVPEWPIRGVPYQRDFHELLVEPVVSKGNKLFVIISDALRYEVAEELHQRILKEDRFRSQLSHQISVLPSYTQLGMAALLPKARLSIVPEKGDVHADGQRTGGLEARDNLLKKFNPRAVAVKASEFLGLNAKEEGRALARDHDLIYIYQNGIDHVGDKRETETEVFDAVAKEIETLIGLLKKIAAINGNNILITADHGFLFQHSVLDESDYTQTPEADDIGMVNRRFAFAAKFEPCWNCKVFSAKSLGLDGDLEVAIPKSINRFRKQGSGARFVHGGATLQEIVVPILLINKARKSDVEQVEVDVIRTGSNTVTTSQINLRFYQETPAIEKQLGRTLRAGFYAQDGNLLSDQKELVFDSSQDDPRLRERKVSFVFGKLADQTEYQNTEILFRLEEPIKGSNRFKTYKEFRYRLKKAFESDFE